LTMTCVLPSRVRMKGVVQLDFSSRGFLHRLARFGGVSPQE